MDGLCPYTYCDWSSSVLRVVSQGSQYFWDLWTDSLDPVWPPPSSTIPPNSHLPSVLLLGFLPLSWISLVEQMEELTLTDILFNSALFSSQWGLVVHITFPVSFTALNWCTWNVSNCVKLEDIFTPEPFGRLYPNQTLVPTFYVVLNSLRKRWCVATNWTQTSFLRRFQFTSKWALVHLTSGVTTDQPQYEPAVGLWTSWASFPGHYGQNETFSV